MGHFKNFFAIFSWKIMSTTKLGVVGSPGFLFLTFLPQTGPLIFRVLQNCVWHICWNQHFFKFDISKILLHQSWPFNQILHIRLRFHCVRHQVWWFFLLPFSSKILLSWIFSAKEEHQENVCRVTTVAEEDHRCSTCQVGLSSFSVIAL